MQHGVLAQSFANRGDQDLTVWGRVGCSKTALWRIYPGGGTFVPHAPFPVAAITVGS